MDLKVFRNDTEKRKNFVDSVFVVFQMQIQSGTIGTDPPLKLKMQFSEDNLFFILHFILPS